MSVWQRLNAPRNKREKRVAKIARDRERERIIALLEGAKCYTGHDEGCWCGSYEDSIALINGENE